MAAKKKAAAKRKPGRPRKKPAPAKKPPGRPSKYDPSIPDRAHKLCALFGLTDEGLATALNVDRATISRWKLEHEGFKEALQEGKDEFDSDRVEASLLKAACGYRYKEISETTTAQGGVEVREVSKEAPPNPTSMIFWLKNRRAARWRDKQEIDTGEKQILIHINSSVMPDTAKNTDS